MTITNTVLQPGVVLGTSATLVVSGAAAVATVITRMVLTNSTAANVAITVYRVPHYGVVGPNNEIVSGRTIIAAPGTDLMPELAGMVLAPGETVQALAATANAVNAFASGYVVT